MLCLLLIGASHASLLDVIGCCALAVVDLSIALHGMGFCTGYQAGSWAFLKVARSCLLLNTVWLVVGVLLCMGFIGKGARQSGGSDLHCSLGWSHVGNGARL